MFFRERNSPSLRNTSKAEGRHQQQQQQRQTLLHTTYSVEVNTSNSRYGGSPTTSYTASNPIRSAHASQGRSTRRFGDDDGGELTVLLADVEYSEAVCRERIENSLRLLRIKLKVLFAEGKDAAHRWEGIRGRAPRAPKHSSSSVSSLHRTKEERRETLLVEEKVRMVLPSPNQTSPQSPPRALLPPLSTNKEKAKFGLHSQPSLNSRTANVDTLVAASPQKSRIVERLSERAARGRRDEGEESYNELLEGVRYLLAEDFVSDMMEKACRNALVSVERGIHPRHHYSHHDDNKDDDKDYSSSSSPLLSPPQVLKRRARAVELLRAGANSGRKLGSTQEQEEGSPSRRDFSGETAAAGGEETSDHDHNNTHHNRDTCNAFSEERLFTPFQRIRLRASVAIREKFGDDQVAELLSSVGNGGKGKGVGDQQQYDAREEEDSESPQRDPDIERIQQRLHKDRADSPDGNVSPSKLRPKKSGNIVRRKQQRLQFLESKSREQGTENEDSELGKDERGISPSLSRRETGGQEGVYIGRREDVVLQKEPALSVSHTAQALLSEEYWARQQAGSTARDRYMNDPLFLLSTSAKLAMFGHVYDSSSRLIKKASVTYVRAWGEHFDGVERAMNAARNASPALKSEADRKRMLHEQDPDFAEKQRLKSSALASSPPRLLQRRARLNSNLKPLYDDMCELSACRVEALEAKAEEVNEKLHDEPSNSQDSGTFKQNSIYYSEGGQKALTLPPIINNRGGHVAVTIPQQLAKRGKTKKNNSPPASSSFHPLSSLPPLLTVTSASYGPPRYMAEYYVEEERRKAQQTERSARNKAYTFRLDERAWWMRSVREDALRAKLMREQARTAEDDHHHVEKSESSIKDRALLITVEEKKSQQKEDRELSEEDTREEVSEVRHTVVLHIPPPPPPSQHADEEPAALE